ncbi:hypothetical protein N9E38_00240 [Yoonia sp.]|nr:hypothetical protein [Yoonia sp.]
MKNVSQSMAPREAARAFYGQDEAVFASIVEKLAENDPRLVDVFKLTRKRYLENEKS